MCAIAGIVSSQINLNQPIITGTEHDKNLNQLKIMLATQNQRGPDGQQIWHNQTKTCWLGHRLLKITDMSDAALQPQTCPCCGIYTMTFNGEIYNYLQIKQELIELGRQFEGCGDTQVLLQAICAWGLETTLNKIEGMFAIALWDQKTQTIFLVRDYFGIKPLYYTQQKDDLYFASSLPAILATHAGIWKINQTSLLNYLQFYCVPGPETLVETILSVPAGSILQFFLNKITITSWVKQSQINDTNTIEQIEQSIREQMPTNQNFGILLSAGIDSNLIASQAKVEEKKFATFSIGFQSNSQIYDESIVAKKYSNFYQSQHHELKIDAQYFASHFDQFVSQLNQPTGDAINTFFACQLAQPHTRILLSGLGADELLFGYNFVTSMKKTVWLSQHWWGKFLIQLIQWVTSHFSLFRSVLFHLGLQTIATWNENFDQWYANLRRIRTKKEARNILNLPTKETEKKRVRIKPSYIEPSSIWKKLQAKEKEFYLQSMLLPDADNCAMMHSIELRVPFLNRQLWQEVERLSELEHNQVVKLAKQPLLDKLRQLNPTYQTKPKTGFELPMGEWLLQAQQTKLDQLLTTSMFCKKQITNELIAFHRQPSNYMRVYSLLVLQMWLTRHEID